VPNHPIALSLLKSFENLGGNGLAAPSANRFGAVSPTNSAAVKEELESYLNSEDLILDGGSCSVGVESTIIDCTGKAPKILRLGAITSEMIESSTGIELFENSSEVKIRVSGSLQSHYAPKAKVLLNADPKPGDFLIALAQYPAPANVNRLVEPRDVEEYARQLYFALRLADIKGLASVVAIEPRGGGLAAAIRDRLSKAASGK
jgi:L-threonylcarbamoyladenylate synthase